MRDNRVVPLEPEFIVPQDGDAKQDCESQAARRRLAAHATRYARFRPFLAAIDNIRLGWGKLQRSSGTGEELIG